MNSLWLIAMTVNLFGPYQAAPSPPRSRDVVFFAPESDTFLFPGPPSPRIICRTFQRALSLEWSVSRNRVDIPFLSGSAKIRFDNSFEITIPGDKLEPGFFDLRVAVKLNEHETLPAATTFGWRETETKVHPLLPADFLAFWSAARKHLEAIPPDPQVTFERVLRGDELGRYNVTSARMPENYDPEGERVSEVEVYKVRFASYGGKTIEGWFAKPPGPGPFPTLLVLPGAGNVARAIPIEHARHGFAALDVQIHGFPVDATEYPPVPDDMGAKHPEEKAHFGLYLHALQAARALKLLPAVDRSRLAVLGGSQGGRLTLIVAAFDSDFRAAIPAITHFAYLPWLRDTDRLNAAKLPGDGPFVGNADPSPSLRIEGYFDVLNFAPLVRCPVLMNAGLIDRVSPPTGIYAVYRALGGEKQIIPLPNTAHDWSPAFDRYAWRWLEATLNPRK